MRRRDREITDREEMIRVMEQCDVCRLALNGKDGFPYLLPLNFGMREENGTVVLYFHGALTGTKYELMEADGRASFEMDRGHRLVTDEQQGECTMEYESVIGRGRIVFVPDEEKEEALRILMKHYHKEAFAFHTGPLPKTRCFKLVVEEMTGKRRPKKGTH